MEPEACFRTFVRVLLGWLSNRSLYQIFSVSPSLVYQAVGTQANDDFIFNLTFQFERYFGNVCLRPHGLVQKRRIYWKCLVQALVASGPISWLISKCKQYKLRTQYWTVAKVTLSEQRGLNLNLKTSGERWAHQAMPKRSSASHVLLMSQRVQVRERLGHSHFFTGSSYHYMQLSWSSPSSQTYPTFTCTFWRCLHM